MRNRCLQNDPAYANQAASKSQAQDLSLAGLDQDLANPPGTKILHLTANPANNAQQATIDGLRARVNSLRMQLEVAQAGELEGTGGGKDALAAAASAASLIEAQGEVDKLRKHGLTADRPAEDTSDAGRGGLQVGIARTANASGMSSVDSQY